MIDTIREAVLVFAGAETCTDDLTCVAVTVEETNSDFSLARAYFHTSSEARQLPVIRAFVRTFCQNLTMRVLDEEGVDQLELAVTEAASNIMRHAYQGRSDQPIQLVAEAFSDRVIVRLFHHGIVFDPETVRPPAFDGSREGGFGVYIITHSVDEVHYAHDEQQGNCICLVKKRKPLQEGEG